jgi:hypothetical protein
LPPRGEEILMSMLLARAGTTGLLDLQAITVALATAAVLGTPW